MSDSKQPQDDTRSKILDTAQDLFAREGYHNTSLRKITSEAEVNLAAVNYHFGGKEALLEAVLERGITPINEQRHQRLTAIEEAFTSSGKQPQVRELFCAFIDPIIEHKRHRDASSFYALIGRAIIEQDATVRTIFHRLVGPTFLQFVGLMKKARPGLPEEDILWRCKFAMGAMGHLLCSGSSKAPLPFPGFNPDRPIEELAAMLINFIVAGMEAP